MDYNKFSIEPELKKYVYNVMLYSSYNYLLCTKTDENGNYILLIDCDAETYEKIKNRIRMQKKSIEHSHLCYVTKEEYKDTKFMKAMKIIARNKEIVFD